MNSKSILKSILMRCGVPGNLLDERYEMNHLQAFDSALKNVGRSLVDATSILDFGCGRGRLAKHMIQIVPEASLHGVDVLQDSVAHCRRTIKRGKFLVSGTKPPLEFQDKSFDLIYSYSVFTHLSEPNHKDWLRELARILKPGGVMLHTIHSEETIWRIARYSPGNIVKYGLGMAPENYNTEAPGYHYNVNIPSLPEYGVTVIRRSYIENNWPKLSGLKLVAYVDAAIETFPEGCHDLVVLARE